MVASTARLMCSPSPAQGGAGLRVAVAPSGALLVDPAGADADETSDGLPPAARARVPAAFRRGPGHGLLDLGTPELEAPLAPPLAFLRDLGRAFATRLCATPDLEEGRERVEVDCPADERARLASAVPPMPGGEYVGADWIAARWMEIGRAFAEEIRGHRGAVAEWLRARHPSWHLVGKVCLHLAENRGDDEHPFAFLATYAVRAPPASARGQGARRRQETGRAGRGRPPRLLGRRHAGRREAVPGRAACAPGLGRPAGAGAWPVGRARPRAPARAPGPLGPCAARHRHPRAVVPRRHAFARGRRDGRTRRRRHRCRRGLVAGRGRCVAGPDLGRAAWTR